MIKLKSKDVILNYLKENNSSESDLCEICETDMCYFFIYPGVDSSLLLDNILGLCIVKAKDGYFSIPIESIHDGMEYLDATTVQDLSDQDIEYYKAKVEQSLNSFKIMVNM